MKRILLLLPIFLLAFTMAIYAGETITVEHNLGTDNLVYTIVDNSTVIPELNVSVNSTHITIFFPYDTPVDNFKLIFIEEQTKEVIKEVKVSGGGGTKTVTEEVNNTVYVNDTRYIEVEKDCPSCMESDNTEVPEETDESDESLGASLFSIALAALLILGIIFGVYELFTYLYRSRKEDYSEI